MGKRERDGALDGDTVKVQVIKPSLDGKKAEAKVIGLVKRTEKVLVGKYIKRPKSSFGFVQVVEGFAGKDIFISDRDSLGAKNDEIVTIRVFGDKNKPHGKVVSILGHKDSQGMAERIVLHENGIIKEFAPHILSEAEKLRSQTLTPGRVDLRSEWIVTIDGADAKDLDDAIGIKKLPNGNFELGVHIADVAEYVREGSALDREAFQRGTSIYTPDEVIPMLPEHLSNNLCSLHPGSPKATLSITMELDQTGKVLRSRIDETLIESKQRFTYDEVQGIIDTLDGKNSPHSHTLVSEGGKDKKIPPIPLIKGGDDEGVGGIFSQYSPEIIDLIRNGLSLKRILDKRRAKE